MKTNGQFILFTVEEFAHWLTSTQFSRAIARIQNHHTWKPEYSDFNGSNHFARLEAMRDFHVNHNGWADIAQNLTTFPDGTVAVSRSFEKTPACIKGANSGAICIENLGNFDDGRDEMTAAHKDCIVRVNALLCRRFKLTPNTETIVYHHWYDLESGERNDGTHNNKSCPGTNFFGGNKVEDCEANFLSLVRGVLAGRKLKLKKTGKTKGKAKAARIVRSRNAQVRSPDGVLSLRMGPSGSATKVGELANGAPVVILEVNGDWSRIDPPKPVWVASRFLVAAEEPVVPAKKPAKGKVKARGPFPEFDLPEPKASDLGKPFAIWGTYYYGQPAHPVTSGVALRNMKGEVVGPQISQRDWCLGAMEGTIIFQDSNGDAITFNYEGKGATTQTSCKAFFPNLNPAILAGTERVRWHRAKGSFGDGAGNFILSPFRTLAVDKNVIPLGTSLYIPRARGVKLILPDGTAAVHDGYFFAGDVGGAIQGNHADFFLGPTSQNPFRFVTSSPQNTFAVHRALNPTVCTRLTKMHTV